MAESNTRAAPIWARPEPAARRPRLSRDQIAAAALAIADAEGFEAVSMRRIAASLGAGTMSLYRYIATKDDLLALIDDAMLRESLVPGELPADWRDATALIARSTRAAYLRHPWAAQIRHGKPAAEAAVAGPNGLRYLEQSLAALAAAPLDLQAKVDLLAIVHDYVYGHVLHAAELAQRAQAGADVVGATADFVGKHLDSSEFPELAGLATQAGALLIADPDRLDVRFERGLRLLIDGFAVDQSGDD
jgi:AcrR family transcriptional regulator